MKEDVYIHCPTYETQSFVLRLVEIDDAQDLLNCYADKAAVSKMNADNCTSDFYYKTVEQMQQCIAFWLEEYKKKSYVRFAIVEKQTHKAEGTVEIFGGKYGVLRIDISTKYEKPEYIEEILRLAVYKFVLDFGIENLEIKAENTPERMPVYEKYGFAPSTLFRPGLGYYERGRKEYFCADKGVAFCGLACCVCSENEDCAGCRNDGCKDKDWCRPYHCCKSKGLKGCWECDEFPCKDAMFDKPRVRAFAKIIGKYGEQKLIAALKSNEDLGITYHYKGKLTGDYDLPSNEEEIAEMVLYAKHIFL